MNTAPCRQRKSGECRPGPTNVGKSGTRCIGAVVVHSQQCCSASRAPSRIKSPGHSEWLHDTRYALKTKRQLLSKTVAGRSKRLLTSIAGRGHCSGSLGAFPDTCFCKWRSTIQVGSGRLTARWTFWARQQKQARPTVPSRLDCTTAAEVCGQRRRFSKSLSHTNNLRGYTCWRQGQLH